MLQTVCNILYYIYILFFGVYCTVRLACGGFTPKHWRILGMLCSVLLLVQGILLELVGMDWIWKLYPLIVHLPIVLALILLLRVKWDAAVFSVIVSYSLCQMLRWIGLAVDAFCRFPVAALIIHLSLCVILLLLLDKYCLLSLHKMLCQSGKSAFFFSALPLLYYAYEYFMLYTRQYYAEIQALEEFLPTAMLLFFTLFAVLFQRESEKRRSADRQSMTLKMELDHAEQEMVKLRAVGEQTAIYRHDMRHHLGMISSLLSSEMPEQAAEYVNRLASKIEAIVPRRYCENDTVNILLASFQEKAERAGVALSVKASLPAQLALNDTELCVILSNGLENALNAVADLPQGAEKTVSVFLGISRNKMLAEIKNPYAGEVILENGVPVGKDQKQHYGCRSILSVVQGRNGICSFQAQEGFFLLQIAIPLS